MANASRARIEADVARATIHASDATRAEKVEMLMEIAMGLQQKPKTADDILDAIALYEEGMALCEDDTVLLKARVGARLATAQMRFPADDATYLQNARANIEAALETLRTHGNPSEIAEAEMNYGLILQNLSTVHQARIQDCISAYQRALRTFDAKNFPAEFAILQNNLATAFLSIPFTDERGKMREALAVQAFEEGLKGVSLVDHPSEYAMLQNNLGNALQYVSSSHRIENGFRALEAYDEALRVRTKNDTPIEYANTISNKANCLANLPDDPQNPQAGNPDHIKSALSLYHEAMAIFRKFGENQKVDAVSAAILELEMPEDDTQNLSN